MRARKVPAAQAAEHWGGTLQLMAGRHSYTDFSARAGPESNESKRWSKLCRCSNERACSLRAVRPAAHHIRPLPLQATRFVLARHHPAYRRVTPRRVAHRNPPSVRRARVAAERERTSIVESLCGPIHDPIPSPSPSPSPIAHRHRAPRLVFSFPISFPGFCVHAESSPSCPPPPGRWHLGAEGCTVRAGRELPAGIASAV